VEPLLLLGHGRSLLLKVLQEIAQGLDGVSGIDGSAAGADVQEDEATWVKKFHDHLFGLADMPLRL
jgi:hypothetical protein